MAKYAEIINKGECYSSLDLLIEGIPACKAEWNRHNFYPQNGMVGEVIEIDTSNILFVGNGINILKIASRIYVPISSRGIKIISKMEYDQKKNKAQYGGMDDEQKKINQEFDKFTSRSFSFGKPDYRKAFESDILANVKARTNNFSKPMYMPELIKECVMYACDICLHFKNESGGLLSNDWKLHIQHQVCDVFEDIFPEFNEIERVDSIRQIEDLLKQDSISVQDIVNQYYFRK